MARIWRSSPSRTSTTQIDPGQPGMSVINRLISARDGAYSAAPRIGPKIPAGSHAISSLRPSLATKSKSAPFGNGFGFYVIFQSVLFKIVQFVFVERRCPRRITISRLLLRRRGPHDGLTYLHRETRSTRTYLPRRQDQGRLRFLAHRG